MGVKPAISLGFRAAEATTYTATYTENENVAANWVLWAAAALDRPDRAARALHTTSGDIVEPLARLID